MWKKVTTGIILIIVVVVGVFVFRGKETPSVTTTPPYPSPDQTPYKVTDLCKQSDFAKTHLDCLKGS